MNGDWYPWGESVNGNRAGEYARAWNRWSLQAAWGKWSAQQDFSKEDMANMAQLNRDIWYSTSGYKIPYPGESQVLYTGQVPGGSTKPATAGNGDS